MPQLIARIVSARLALAATACLLAWPGRTAQAQTLSAGSTMATSGAPVAAANAAWTNVQKLTMTVEGKPVIAVSGRIGPSANQVSFYFDGTQIENIVYAGPAGNGHMFMCSRGSDFPCDSTKYRFDVAAKTGTVKGLVLYGAAPGGVTTIVLTGVIK